MSEVVTVKDDDGNVHWTAAGSETARRFAEPEQVEEVEANAEADAPPADPDPATGDDRPEHREADDTTAGGRRGSRKS